MAAEKNFENRVKTFLKDKGAWVLKYWGGADYTKRGVPDLLVCFNGRFIGIELKAPRGKPSDLQIYNLREIDRSGGYAVLLYPDDYPIFQTLIQAIQSGDEERAESAYLALKVEWKYFENKMNKGD